MFKTFKRVDWARCLFIGAVLGGSLLSSGALYGNDGTGDSLETALRQALDRNPDLLAFRERYEAAKERVPQVSSLPDPMLQVTHFVESVQTRTGPQENIIMLNQKIPWFGKLNEREAIASAEAEVLWFAYRNRELSLVRKVADLYYELGYLDKALELTEQNVSLLEELKSVVQQKVSAGGDLNELLRVKVEIGKKRDQWQSIKEKRLQKRSEMAALFGMSGPGNWTLSDWSAPEPWSPEGAQLVQDLEKYNPEISMLKRTLSSFRARHELARLEKFPDLSLGINYIQLGESLNPNTVDSGRDPWGITLSFNIPIWGGKNVSREREVLASHRAAEQELLDRTNQLKAELSTALSALSDARRRLTLYGEELLDLAEQSLEITQTSYEAGNIGILEVIDSERTLLELKLLYWRAAADAWQAMILVKTLVNETVPSSLISR